MPRMKFITVCTPTLGNVSIEWASALRALMLPLNYGYSEAFAKDNVGGEIAEGRNGCVAQAMSYESAEREVTHLFWIDDDVIFPRTALLQLLQHNRDIASGVYFTKCEQSEALIFPGRGCGTLPFVPNQVQDVWGHGMGLTLVKLDVYRHMRDKGLPLDKYGRPQWYKTPSALDATVQDEVLFAGGTEDLYFLDQAGKLGYQPLVDTSQFCFGWHYDGKAKQGYPKKQWEQQQRGKPIEWDTPDGVVRWGGPQKPPEPKNGKAVLVGDESPHTVLR